MRAEEGDESIKDYAKEARDTQGKVSGRHRTLPRKLLKFLGFGQGDAGSKQGGHR
jgi:hypothetical protein